MSGNNIGAGWKLAEETLLFDEACIANQQGRPLKSVFMLVAKKTGRKPNSIRNYYYQRIREDESKAMYAGKNGAFVPFTQGEMVELLRRVFKEKCAGKSVRACTLEMGGGDNKAMLRYQNKYRALIKSNPELVKSVIDELLTEGFAVPDPYKRPSGQKRAVGRPRKSSTGLLDTISGVISDLDEQLFELRERLKDQAYELEAQKERFSTLLMMFRQLMGINREFLGLNNMAKMSSLTSYIRELSTNVESCERLISNG